MNSSALTLDVKSYCLTPSLVYGNVDIWNNSIVCCRLRTLSHGSSGHASNPGLAPLSSRAATKPASIQYSRDAFLSFYNASVSSEVPEGLRALHEIIADRTLLPMAWIPQSNDEVVCIYNISITFYWFIELHII